MKVIITIIISSFVFIFSSCYNDNKEELYILFDNGVCDTVNVTYEKNIKQIFNSHCVACHNGSNPVSNYNDFANSHSYAIKPNTDLYTIVKDGTHKSQILDDCEKNQLKIWIATGAN